MEANNRQPSSSSSYDFIIVGAGACGTVVAAKLARAFPDLSILLLEAGGDNRTSEMIDAMKKQNPMQLWADPNITFNDCNAARSTSQSARAYPVGRIVGGGSAINGMGAIRGHPDDFLEWEETFMVKGWGWETMLKAFKDLESDPMAAERPDIHGADGPIPIYRSKCETWGPVAATMKKGCMETLGFGWSEDLNDPESTGVSPFPMNMKQLEDGSLCRVSTNDGFLDPVRNERFPNLTVQSSAVVDKVLFDAALSKAIGVSVRRRREERIDAEVLYFCTQEIVLTAGAVYSPAILQRSGVGPKALLDALGIGVVRNFNVGYGLQDHPVINGKVTLRTYETDPEARHANSLARFTSDVNEGGVCFNDLYFVSVDQGNDPRAKEDAAEAENALPVGYIDVMLMKCNSRGTVAIKSTDPYVSPDVSENMLSDPIDLKRMRYGVRKLVQLFESPAMREIAEVNDETGKPLIELGRANDGLSKSLDKVTAMNDHELNAWMRNTLSDGIHVSCSIPMGLSDYIDANGCIESFNGTLRVADASIMPSVPRANTHLTSIAVGLVIATKMVKKVQRQRLAGSLEMVELETNESKLAHVVKDWIATEWPVETKASAVSDSSRRRFRRTWVAVNGKDVYGTASIYSHDMDGKDDKLFPWLAAVFVPSDKRGLGVGKTLVMHTIHEFKSSMLNAEFQDLYLWFPASKAHLEKFYLSCGFVVEERALYKSSSFGENIVIMKLALG